MKDIQLKGEQLVFVVLALTIGAYAYLIYLGYKQDTGVKAVNSNCVGQETSVAGYCQ